MKFVCGSDDGETASKATDCNIYIYNNNYYYHYIIIILNCKK